MSIKARPPRDGLVRALPRLELINRASEEDEEAGEIEEPGEDAAEESAEEQEEATPTLAGHFAVFNDPTEINSYYEGNFIELIAPGAFKKTFQEQVDNIRCLFQHGMDFHIGDKPLGPIEELAEDDIGAAYAVPLLDTHYNRELIPGLEKDLYGASFCFRVVREEYDEEPDPTPDNPKGLPVRTLLELQVFEFGPVTFPAYDTATAGLRSMTDDYLAAQLSRDPQAVEEILERADRPEQLAELFARRGVRSVPRLRLTRSETAPPAEEPAATVDEPVVGEDGVVRHAEEVAAAAAGDTPDVQPEPEAEATETPEAPAGERAADEADTEAEATVPKQDPAPPEGADRSGHANPGRRDQEPTPDAPPASDTKGNAMTLDELRARQEAIRSRLVAIDEEHRDAELPEAIQTEYTALTEERTANEAAIGRVETRQAEVRTLSRTPENRESGDGAHFNTQPSHESDPYDFPEIMSRARGAGSEEARTGVLRDAALRAIDAETMFFHERVDPARAKSDIEHLLRREALPLNPESAPVRSGIAERILQTGSEMYQRSFMKAVAGAPLTSEEQRSLATFTGSAGGFAVPYQLDPTLIKTSNSSVNPFRAISRVETLVNTNEWKGVTSGAITAGYAAEGAESSDNSPVLAQPTAIPERAQAFVPFSYEIEQDWSAALAEMAGLIGEAKDDLEAVKFLEGAGHGSTEPQGLLTGATTTVAAGGTAAFAVADLYKLEQELPPRFRAQAQFLANRAIYNKIRQFDTAGGAALWVWLREGLGNNGPTPGNVEAKLAGYPVNEVSSMKEVLTTATKILAIGNFKYFLIADRIGMNVEVIPNLFGASGRPTGQRGLYAIWRNTSKVLSASAFRVLVTS